MHKFLQNSVFNPKSERFVILAKRTPFSSSFHQSARVCTKQRFLPEISTFPHFRTGCTTFKRFSAKCTCLYKTLFFARDQHGLSFPHWVRHNLQIFIKVHKFVQNSVFSPRSAHSVIFALGALLIAIFRKMHEIVQCSVFSLRSARFVISAIGASILSYFQQSARVCTKQSFQPKIRRFSRCHTEHTTILQFSAKCTSLVQNSVFSSRSARFLIFALGAPPFSDFQHSAQVCTRQKFSAWDQHVLSFSP